jgi:hypothetical protein
MALDAQALAEKLHDALAQKTDGNGKPTEISDQTKNYAQGIVDTLKAGIVTNLPGTINGITAPGASLSLGTGVGGTIILQPGTLQAVAAKGVAPAGAINILKENAAIVGYLMTGLVVFSAGDITGTCTNTPVSPGALTFGQGSNGKIIGLTGAGAMGAVISVLGFTGPDMFKHYDALINYIVSEASVTYKLGSVVGVCPAGGGPLTLGAGIGGTIS